jgi:heme O synthase-like polyprenyltransferase
MLKIKLALSIAFLVMLTAMLLAVFGLMGWTFHIHIYQERRRAGRERATDK